MSEVEESEQGSVKQFFSLGLVNTKAVYTAPRPDGSIKVVNSGNYFGPTGPESIITGSAVAVFVPLDTGAMTVTATWRDPSGRILAARTDRITE